MSLSGRHPFQPSVAPRTAQALRTAIATGLRARRGTLRTLQARTQRDASQEGARARTAALRLGFEAQLYRGLLAQVHQRDPHLARAFQESVRPLLHELSRREEEGGQPAAFTWLRSQVQALDLSDLRRGRAAQSRPSDRVLFARYVDVMTVLRGLPRKTRNPAARQLRLRELLSPLLLRDVLPVIPAPAKMEDWATLPNEEIALHVVAYPYRSTIGPGTLRKILSSVRAAARRRSGATVDRSDPTK